MRGSVIARPLDRVEGMTRLLVPSLLAIALLAPAASAVQTTVPVPGLGCSVTVAGPEVVVYMTNPPRYAVSGPTGVWTDCP